MEGSPTPPDALTRQATLLQRAAQRGPRDAAARVEAQAAETEERITAPPPRPHRSSAGEPPPDALQCTICYETMQQARRTARRTARCCLPCFAVKLFKSAARKTRARRR